MYRTILTSVALALALIGVTERPAFSQLMPKAQVANLIAKVENGVDQFRDYLEKRGDNAKDAKDAGATAQASGRRKGKTATENQKANASTKKDALDEPWRQTGRPGCGKFGTTDAWMGTKVRFRRRRRAQRSAGGLRGSYGPKPGCGPYATASAIWRAVPPLGVYRDARLSGPRGMLYRSGADEAGPGRHLVRCAGVLATVLSPGCTAAALSIAQGDLGAHVSLPFSRDVELHMRLLIAVP